MNLAEDARERHLGAADLARATGRGRDAALTRAAHGDGRLGRRLLAQALRGLRGRRPRGELRTRLGVVVAGPLFGPDDLGRTGAAHGLRVLGELRRVELAGAVDALGHGGLLLERSVVSAVVVEP